MGSSNKKNRDFVSAFGTAADAFQKLAQEVYVRGGDDEALRRIISDEALRERMADLIVGASRQELDVYTVTVDWGRTLAEMVAAGGFDRGVDDDIVERNFPLMSPTASDAPDCGPYRTADMSAAVDTGLELVHLGKPRTTAKVEAELAHKGFRPATLPELLAFGEKYPDVQRQFPVVALGSSWVGPGGDRRIPCLCGSSGYRYLRLLWGDPGDKWGGLYRFLAVRKTPHVALRLSGA